MPTSRALQSILQQYLEYYERNSQGSYSFLNSKPGDLDRAEIIKQWKELIKTCSYENFDETKPVFVLLLLNSKYSTNHRNPRLQETVQKFITQEQASIPNYLKREEESKAEHNHHIIDLLHAQITSLQESLVLVNRKKRHERRTLEKEISDIKSLLTEYKKILSLNMQTLQEARGLLQEQHAIEIRAQLIKEITPLYEQLEKIKHSNYNPSLPIFQLDSTIKNIKEQYIQLQDNEKTVIKESNILSSMISHSKEEPTLADYPPQSELTCINNSTQQTTIPKPSPTSLQISPPPPPPPPAPAIKTQLPPPPPPPPPQQITTKVHLNKDLIEKRNALLDDIRNPERHKLKAIQKKI